MNILIAGASGFVGRHLIHKWSGQHQITVVGRNKSKLKNSFSKDIVCYQWDELKQINAKNIDIVINLCGYNIGKRRWSKSIKKKIIDSRVQTTKLLITWLSDNKTKPHFYCANAVGLYGLQNSPADIPKTEDSAIESENPKDFLTKVGVLWKNTAENAIEHGIPLTITCFGVILGKHEGMLKKMAPAFRLGMGSIIGNGDQNITWVHINDVINAYDFLIHHPEITGLINLSAPNPVTQKIFAKTLAKVMHRPLLLKTPEFIIRILLGEMGDCLILKGQSMLPKRLQELGFKFVYLNIEDALTAEYCKS